MVHINKLFKKIKKIIFIYYVQYQDERLINNYYKTNFSKNVLISYINFPFLKKGKNYSHTNYTESFAIATVFKKLQFNVDIINYNRKKLINYNKYNIVFGFGRGLSESFFINESLLRIYYGTGAHPYISNQKTLLRVREVFDKTGQYIINSSRLVKEDYLLQTTLVDGLVILGNSFTASTYKKFTDKPIFLVAGSFYKIFNYKEIIAVKNFYEAKNNFLFFSGPGMVHKGLDLLLEVFSKHPNWHLHICARVENENKFNNQFIQQLSNTNIHIHNFVELTSPLFKKLLTVCAFVVLPSCSERTPGSILNVIGNGALIPIVTKESGVNLNGYGIQIDSFSTGSIDSSLTFANNLSIEEINDRSLLAGQTICNNHSLQEFSDQLENSLHSLIKI